MSLVVQGTPSINRALTIEARSLSHDMQKTNFVWSVGGVRSAEGVGVRTFTLTPTSADTITVSVIATTPAGLVIRQSVELRPTSVFLTWEGETAVPHFYKGRSQSSSQSTVRFVAFPEFVIGGARVDPKTLVYRWKVGGMVDQSQSGYGAQSFLHREGIAIRDFTVEVDVESRDGRVKGSASLTHRTGSPRVLVYQEDPLYGILYNRTVNERLNMIGNETRLSAIPLFFSSSAYEAGLGYNWIVNGKERGDVSQPYIVLRTQSADGGVASVGIDVSNDRDILQRSQKFFDIIFSPQTNQDLPIFQ